MRIVLVNFTAACALFTGSSPVYSAESVKATVNGMVCAFFAQGIEKRLSRLPATLAVYVDLKRRVVAVEAKPGQKLDTKLIAAEIADAGYDVARLETVAQSVEQIKAETRVQK